MNPLLDHAPCGFVSITDDGVILTANATLHGLLGYGPGELCGLRFERVLSPGGRVFYQTHFFPLLKLHGHADEIYFSLRTRDGSDVPVLVNARRREQDGECASNCVFFPIRQRDQYENEILTAKKTAEAALRTRDEFLAVVTHELRSPLNAILGWTHLLRTGRLDGEKTQKAFETIERNVKAQSQLIEDLLDLSRMNAGKLRLTVGPVEVSSVVEAAIDVVRPAAEAKQIEICPVLDPGAGPISGDPDRLQQVMWNLLSNAVKFTPRGGSVQVRLERVNSHVQVTVSDTGQGIGPDFLPYVFERFHQAEGAASDRRGGLGLGMAISRELVELHGGTIRAESPGEGQGATFILRLPIMIVHGTQERPDKETGSPALSPPESQGRLEGLQVLVVDDDPDGRSGVAEILSRQGAEVAEAASVSDALRVFEGQRVDLLVSDIEMPGEDGYALVRKLRAFEKEGGRFTPAIALTARAGTAERLRALSAGFQTHVPKPVDPTELITVIASLALRI